MDPQKSLSIGCKMNETAPTENIYLGRRRVIALGGSSSGRMKNGHRCQAHYGLGREERRGESRHTATTGSSHLLFAEDAWDTKARRGPKRSSVVRLWRQDSLGDGAGSRVVGVPLRKSPEKQQTRDVASEKLVTGEKRKGCYGPARRTKRTRQKNSSEQTGKKI